MNFADAEYTINEVKRLQKYDKRREGFIPPSVKIQEIERKSDTVKIKYRLDISDDELKAMIKGKDGIGVYSNGVRLSKILGAKIYIKNWSSNNHFNQDIYIPERMEQYFYSYDKFLTNYIEGYFVYNHIYNANNPLRNRDFRKVIIGIYPYTDSGAMNTDCILTVPLSDSIIYKFKLNEYYSNPNDMITYPPDCDNYCFKPADATLYRSDRESSESVARVNLNSWENAFFLPKPCMLKWDGTVDYYLDMRDYRRKDKTTNLSDIDNPDYDGNAMMEWSSYKINGEKRPFYWAYEPNNNGRGGVFTISTHKLYPEMDAWNFYNYRGDIANSFYTAITHGLFSYDSTNTKFGGKKVLRSIILKKNIDNLSYKNKLKRFNNNTDTQTLAFGSTGMHFVKNINNKIYNVDTFNNFQLLLFLTMLMFKTTDMESVIFNASVINLTNNVMDNIISGDSDYDDFFISGLFDGHKTEDEHGYIKAKGKILNKMFGMHCGLFTKDKKRITLGCFINSQKGLIYTKMKYEPSDRNLENGYFSSLFVSDKNLNIDAAATQNEQTISTSKISSRYGHVRVEPFEIKNRGVIFNMMHLSNKIIPTSNDEKSNLVYSEPFINYRPMSPGRYGMVTSSIEKSDQFKLLCPGLRMPHSITYEIPMEDDKYNTRAEGRMYTFGLTCVPLTK